MSEAAKVMLVAQATAEIAERLESYLDFAAANIHSRVLMEVAAVQLGLSAEVGRNFYDKDFLRFKQELLAWAAQTAQAEMAEAVQEAEREQGFHERRLAELNGQCQSLVQMLADPRTPPMPEIVDDDFIRSVDSFRKEAIQRVESFHADFMEIVQMKHRLNLEHCFTSHLVGEATAKKLADLYEVKK